MVKRKIINARVFKSKNPSLRNLFALIIFFLVMLGLFIFLTKYQDKSINIDLSKKEVVERNEEVENTLDAKLKEKVDEALVKYKIPKQATVRKINWEKVGKAYLFFDEKLNKTFFWIKIDDISVFNPEDNFYVWLSEREKPNPLFLNAGELEINSSEGMLYYEFEEDGKFYNYLNVVVSKSNIKEKISEENTVLKASFSDQLN